MSSAGAYARLISESAAYLDPEWFPPAEECDALADLRADHQRLVAAVRDALNGLGQARRDAEATADARAEALREAFLAGHDPAAVASAANHDDELADAVGLYEAACAALEKFVRRAQVELVERAPLVIAALDHLLVAAIERRAEARRLLEEADRLTAQPRQLTTGSTATPASRYSARSHSRQSAAPCPSRSPNSSRGSHASRPTMKSLRSAATTSPTKKWRPSMLSPGRDQIIRAAIDAGKFSEDRAAFWQEQYDRDPAGTERVLASLAPAVDALRPYPAELFPELARTRQPPQIATHPAAASASAAGTLAVPSAPAAEHLTPEITAGWSRALFPNTPPEGAAPPRISRAND